jgi:hypothetical protein
LETLEGHQHVFSSNESKSVEKFKVQPLEVYGKVTVNFNIENHIFPFETCILKDLRNDAILGRDFLCHYDSNIDFKNGCITLSSREPLQSSQERDFNSFVTDTN